MELRTAASPKDVRHYTTERLREEFLIDDLFQAGAIKLVYSHIDRIITGSAVPVEPIRLTAGDELRAEYFCQRRELGVINIGGAGTVTVDGTVYELGYKDCLYITMGAREVLFASRDSARAATPAQYDRFFIMFSVPSFILILPPPRTGLRRPRSPVRR